MIATLIGLAFVGAGAWGVLHWFPDFLLVMRGLIPISLILGGVVAIMAGINSFQKNRGHDKS